VDRQYLIEVLLKARESVTQVAQKVAKSINDVTEAQKKNIATSQQSDNASQQRITALQRLIESHTREKKALEDRLVTLQESIKANLAEVDSKRKSAEAGSASIEAARKAAAAARDEANTRNKTLEQLQRQAALERATAAEKEKRDIEESRRLRLEIADRNAFEGKKSRAYQAETRRLRQQKELLDALNQENAAANRRTAAQLDLQIAKSRSAAQAAERSAVAAEKDVKAQEDAVAAHKKAADAAADAASKQTAAVGRTERAIDRNGLTIDKYNNQLARLNSSTGQAERPTGRFVGALNRVGIASGNTRTGLRGLNAEFQGFQVALAIKYAQALISTLVTLATQLAAVTAAAGQAAIALGAALAAGAAQAIPVVGVLIAAFARLGSVLKAVKLTNDQQLTATQDANRASKTQEAAAEAVRSAEERLADAHRNTTRAVQDLAQARRDAARDEQQAQQAVTDARREAIRTVQDLMAAEEDAALSLLRAQQARQNAIESGDVRGAVEADVDVRRARTGVTRARQDAAPVRARGIEGVEAVQEAEQRLAEVRRSAARQIEEAEQRLGDTRREEAQAAGDLTRTRRTSRESVEAETAAVNRLIDATKELSPAERQLYKRILALQETYKRIGRPITDIITRAFTGVVDRINQVIQDPRIIRGFRGLATEIANSIGAATNEVGGARGVSFMDTLLGEATRNLPQVTRIIINFFRTTRNLITAAIPAFRLLLGYIEDYSERALDASRNQKGLTTFFKDGIRFAKAFFDLGLAVVRLLLAIGGRGGAADEGMRTIRGLTDLIDGLTRKARRNAGAIRDFFAGTHDVFFALLSVLGTLGATIVDSFSASSVTAFADFLNRVIIPALGHVIEIMGFLTTTFHQVFGLPGVAEAAQFVATVLIFARGMTVISSAFASIGAILPNFLRSMGLLRAGMVGLAAVTPAGWIVGAIMAAVAAVVLLDKHLHFLGPTWRWIKEAASDAWEGIKNAAESVASWFSDVWTQGLLYWLRYPFIKLIEWGREVGIFRWIKNAAQDVMEFLGGVFGGSGLGKIIAAPFRGLSRVVTTIFDFLKTTVQVFLDVLAGRFDTAGETIEAFWGRLTDTLAGAVTSMLGVLQKLYEALGKIPKIGGPFREAAAEIRKARDSIDGWREKNRESREEQEKANKTLEEAAPTLARLRKRYEDAREEVRKTKKGTDEHKDATIRARKAQKDYNEKLQETASKSRNARDPVRRLRTNISNLGGTAADTAEAVGKNLNDVLRQIGARTIRLNTRAYKRDRAEATYEATGHLATGGVLQRFGPPRRKLWGGGLPNPAGSSRDDHVLMSPDGRPVAALSGTEGVVNTPQMGVINNALNFTQQMTGMPYGSLNDLWGSGMRHFQTGGALQPAIRGLSSRLNRMFNLITTSGVRSGDTGSLHSQGIAADISGTPRAMMRAANYIKTSGIWRGLAEGIHKPANLSVDEGKRVPASFWGARTWNDHVDHIHIATRSLARMIAARVRQPRIEGLGGDALSRIARGSSRLLTRAANRYLRRQMARMSGGGDAKPMGADANVVRAFRRAIQTTGARGKAKLALWMAGIVESGLKNLRFGDRDSLGALQLRAGLHGRGLALNPFASAVAFLTRGFTGKGGAIALARNRGMTAGQVAQAVQGSAFPGRYDQVRSRAMRYMQTGGTFDLRGSRAPRASIPLAPGISGTRRPAFDPFRGMNLAAMMRRWLQPAIKRMNESFAEVGKTLDTVAGGPLRRSKRLAVRITRAFARLTGENGLLDQVREGVEAISGRAAVRLQRRQFRVTRQGPRRRFLNEAQVASAELGGLRAERGGLGRERDTIQEGIEKAEDALRVAQRRGNKKAAAAARAALVNLRTRLRANADALAQNAQEQVEAVERFQQGLLSLVTDWASRHEGALDRWARTAAAQGRAVDPNAIVDARIVALRAQIEPLRQIMEQARRSGNVELFNQIADQLAEIDVQILEGIAEKFQNAITAITDAAQRFDGAIDRWSRNAAAVGRSIDPNRVIDVQIANMNRQIDGLRLILEEARRTGNVDVFNQVSEQIAELETQVLEGIAQKFQNSITRITESAQKFDAVIDRWSRMTAALGRAADPGVILQVQMDHMRRQITDLQGVLAEAEAAGNVEVANQIREQIAELEVSIAEAAAQQFQAAIDAVNEEATKRNARLDRQARLAQLGGVTNFAAMGDILGQRGNVMRDQLRGLEDLRRQAIQEGNVDQIENLTDQIEELGVAMAENTQAIQANTDAAFDFRTAQINESAGFSQSIFSGVQGFFQALTERTGIDTMPQQMAALQGIATSLVAQQRGLLQQLISMFGWDPGDIEQIMGMAGAELVNYLTYLGTDPKVANILAGYSPAAQEAFRNLITSLISNATAVEQNTQALNQITAPGSQSFASTMWRTFRSAVFTGAGGLLPQYQTTVPTAAVGAHVLRSGMMLVHAGEDVRPAEISRDWGGADGDTYHLNVTTPTEVLNPTDVGRQLAFYRKSQSR
jgi:hypothetical protein